MMKTITSLLACFLLLALLHSCAPAGDKALAQESEVPQQPGPITLVIHGGVGTMTRENMTPEKEASYQGKLKEALDAGYEALENGAKAEEAVIKAITILEDSPLFNAGVGAVFTSEGKNELDASIMLGKDLNAGAVAGVTQIKSPIAAAYAVLTSSEHVMFTGKGAEVFAEEQGLDMVDSDHFYTPRRYNQWLRANGRESEMVSEEDKAQSSLDIENKKYGTVGAVALDQYGDIAAGTSTGGMTNKRYGRVGDSPIIGAGTYADNEACGVSATGHGEFFIRAAVAYDIAARMKYAGLNLAEAAKQTIHTKLTGMGGSGGIVSLDRAGNIAMEFNTPGMYRGFINEKGKAQVAIYQD